MKKKIGEIYNKPIVTGDKNLVTKNEIHESTLKGGGTVDSGSSDVEYWAINVEKVYSLGGDGMFLLTTFSLFKYMYTEYGEIAKCIFGGWRFYDDMNTKTDVIPCAVAFSKIKKNQMEANTLKDMFMSANLDISLFDSVFTPITKEEFYDLNNV